MATEQQTTQAKAIYRGLKALFPIRDSVIEFRAFTPEPDKHVYSGYYNDFAKLALPAAKFSDGQIIDCYVCTNPVSPGLLKRRENRFEIVGKDAATKESDIPLRVNLLVDIGTVRPQEQKDDPATVEEKKKTEKVWQKMYAYLTDELGWPEMLTGSSGNGYHILPYLDLPNTPESTALVKTVQLHLKAKFDAPGVKIDCFEDPNRLTRLYFTRNCKGIESEGRSYWMSKIIHAPENRVVISRELLEKAAKLCPVPVQIREVYDTKEGNCETWMLEEFLIARNWEYSPYGDNAFEVADPWEHEHHTPRGSGTVTVSCINGKFGYSCLRDGCKTFHDVENGVIRKRTWHDFRDAIDPEHEYKFPVEIEPVDLAGNGIELDDTDEAAPEKPAPVTDVGFNPEPTPEKRQHSQPVLEPETIEEFEAEEAAENTEAKADDAVVESEMPPSEVDLTFPESALYGKLSSPSVLSPRPSYDKTLSAGRWIELRGIAEPFRPPPTSKPAIFRIAAVLPCCAFVIT